MTNPADQSTGPGGWDVMTASTRGAAHEATGRPNQDAQGWRILDPGRQLVIGAVADGHGHSRHFRSERGSRLAVEQGCEAGAAFATTLGGLIDADEVAAAARAALVPRVVETWSRAVAEDYGRAPFSAEEEATRVMYDDEAVIAYGSTLLLLVLGPRWAVVAQIGDGDVVLLHADGGVEAPVPEDPSLDGHYTTSLCQSGAADSFRVAVIDRSETPILGLLAATDGFGNAQAAEPWQEAVGTDLSDMLRSKGAGWVRDRLGSWTEQCASSEGSGDDTTVLLAVADQ
jgi:hypothetical protein